MRAFIAITLPEPVKEAIDELGQRLRRSRAKASWVRPDSMHLTLRFLGDVPEAELNRLGERLTLAYRDVASFRLAVVKTGVFPNMRRPKVVWVGVEPLEGGLQSVWKIAESAAVDSGLKPEKRRFRPHLTVARIRDERKLGTLPELLGEEHRFSGGEFEVARVSLFSSRLTPKGPIYRQLREFHF